MRAEHAVNQIIAIANKVATGYLVRPIHIEAVGNILTVFYANAVFRRFRGLTSNDEFTRINAIAKQYVF